MERVSLPKNVFWGDKEGRDGDNSCFLSSPRDFGVKKKTFVKWDDKEPEVHVLGGFVPLTGSFIFKRQKL